MSELKVSGWINLLKSSQVISRVNPELKTKVLEISLVSMIQQRHEFDKLV
jgi:hypothetical protein